MNSGIGKTNDFWDEMKSPPNKAALYVLDHTEFGLIHLTVEVLYVLLCVKVDVIYRYTDSSFLAVSSKVAQSSIQTVNSKSHTKDRNQTLHLKL